MKTTETRPVAFYKKLMIINIIGLLVIPYSFVLLCGFLAQYFTIFYTYADIVLILFFALIALFLALLIYSIFQYRKGNQKKTSGEQPA